MTANTSPIYTKQGNQTWVNLTAAVSDMDGTGGNYGLAFTADATNGSFLQKLILQPKTTNNTNTTFPAGVVRIFLNNGSTAGTAANNTLVRELLLPVLTTMLNTTSTTNAIQPTEVTFNMLLPASYRIYVGYTGALSASIILGAVGIGGTY